MAFARVRALIGRAIEFSQRVLGTVPLVRSIIRGLVRIELIDRSMAIAAQAMLALVPMLVVLAAFLPAEFTSLALDRFRELTGLDQTGKKLIQANVDPDQVRAQTGAIGLLITLFSATSFARAVQRMYEKIWEQPHIGGMLGIRRSTLWLVGWLLILQTVAALGFLLEQVTDFGALRLLIQGAGASLVWWWTSRVLLFGRVPWMTLLTGALLTGFCLVLYSWGSNLVMPAYVASSAAAFGTLGLILAVTTWLVGFAGLLVVASVVGRAVVEDADVRRLSHAVARRVPVLRTRVSGGVTG
ncbi:MAG TPA: YhjD/YihY/BrkB family envelope integrity protein [Nocardioides sp.]|nr:YhjD/YihY/BrkB family envelope integrity protein [Nocardioides sp.]